MENDFTLEDDEIDLTVSIDNKQESTYAKVLEEVDPLDTGLRTQFDFSWVDMFNDQDKYVQEAWLEDAGKHIMRSYKASLKGYWRN